MALTEIVVAVGVIVGGIVLIIGLDWIATDAVRVRRLDKVTFEEEEGEEQLRRKKGPMLMLFLPSIPLHVFKIRVLLITVLSGMPLMSASFAKLLQMGSTIFV